MKAAFIAGPPTSGTGGPPPAAGRRPLVERIAAFSARRRWIALALWLLLVAGAVLTGGMLGTKSLPSYDPGQAGRAERILNRPDVIQQPAESVLVQSRSGTGPIASDPQARQAIHQVVAALAALPRAAAHTRSPLAGGRGLISADGRSALITFTVPGPGSPEQQVAAAQQAVASVQARHPRLLVAEAGDASVGRATNSLVGQDFRRAETTSLPVTLVLLLGVFGALIAAGIPLLLAGASAGTAISLLAIPSRWLPVSSTTSSVVLLIGMAVGVDYTLFYLRREREERAAGP